MTSVAEKLYTVLESKFGKDSGKMWVTVWEIYGLKSNGVAFYEFHTEILMYIGSRSCLVDADVWRKSATKSNSDTYCKYVLTYVDNVLIVLEDTSWVIEVLTKKSYKYKWMALYQRTKYLDAKIFKFIIANKNTWFMSARLFLRNVIDKIEQT